jgi:hypothetical protein
MRAALLVLLALLVPAAPAAGAGTLAAHGMIYLDSPPSFKEAMFAQAAELGASDIRVDVDVSEIVNGGARDWTGLDEDVALARKYHLGVLAVLLGTPADLQRCDASVPEFFRFRCPATDEDRYASYVGEIVRRAGGAIRAWQVLSEPDYPLMFHGDLAHYARRLMKRPGVRGSFDIAALSLRGSVRSVVAGARKLKRALARGGFRGPAWVTEHGYPADTRFQWDPDYRGGAAAQARYLAASLPRLLKLAPRVFVTLRDSRGGPWASEGLLTGSVLDPPEPDPQVIRRPAARVFQRLAVTR